MRKVYYWILGLILASLSFLFDKAVSNFFFNSRVSDMSIFMKFSEYTNGFFSLIFIGIFVLIWKRKLILRYLLGFGFTAIIVYGLKELLQRLRPVEALLGSGFSFPSGHASFAFFALGFIWGDFKKFKWFWLIFAMLIVLVRLYVGAHHISDVSFGVLIGLFLGNLFRKKKIKSLL
ncbi:MAG: phosphatase PAP2 family protein [Nanoarchaeota archaeon]